jgi:hypothetical protein
MRSVAAELNNQRLPPPAPPSETPTTRTTDLPATQQRQKSTSLTHHHPTAAGPISSHQLQRDAIREFVTRTRAEQGLPPTIEDPTTLTRIAAVFGLVKDLKSARDAR